MRNPLVVTSLLFMGVSCVDIETQRSELIYDGETSRSIASDSVYPVSMQVAPRGYVLNVLKDVFSIQDNSSLETTLINDVYKKVEFGGGCDLYEASETAFNSIEFSKETCGSITSDQASTSNPMRFSITSKVCENLLANSTARNNLRNKIFPTGSWGHVKDSDALQRLWRLFYPTESINIDTLNALLNVGRIPASQEEGWVAISFTVCSSPGWQVL